MKNLIKTITATILTVALVLTGIVIPDTDPVTANAATYTKFTSGTSLKLKITDTKKMALYGTDSNGKEENLTRLFKWTSSDPNIVSIETNTKWTYERHYMQITAKAYGTVKITGTSENNPNIKPTMTVTVPKPKKTAKQKKCKHKYKTTKSATCQRIGIKTCKKCKWQETIAKKSHKYVNTASYSIEYDKYVDYLHCTACYCPNIPDKSNHYYLPECLVKGIACPNPCLYEVCIQDYPTVDDAFAAFHSDWEHNIYENPHAHGGWGIREDVGVGKGHKVKKNIKTCKWCGKEKK